MRYNKHFNTDNGKIWWTGKRKTQVIRICIGTIDELKGYIAPVNNATNFQLQKFYEFIEKFI